MSASPQCLMAHIKAAMDQAMGSGLTVMTIETPQIMKVMTVSPPLAVRIPAARRNRSTGWAHAPRIPRLTPDPSPARGEERFVSRWRDFHIKG